jgi:hypothetical protein
VIYVGGDLLPVTFYAFSFTGSVTYPAGLAAGDLMLLTLRGTDPAVPSGWTGIGNADYSAGWITRHAYRFATSGDLGGGQFISPGGTLRYVGALLHVWRDPAVTSFAPGSTPNNFANLRHLGDPADTSIDVPGYTTAAGRVFWVGSQWDNSSGVITPPAGFTTVPLSPNGGWDSYLVAYLDTAAGVVPTTVGSLDVSKQNAGAMYTVPWPYVAGGWQVGSVAL